MNRQLVLHCGGHEVERDQVNEVATPDPTDTWFPIPHTALIDLVERKLPDYGLSIVGQQHALMREEHRYFGMMQVQPEEGNISDDYGLVLGLRNSHDKSFPAGLCLGSGVFVCDNLAFSAEVVIKRRHTRHVMDDLPRLIAAALGKLVDSRFDQQERIDAYKNEGITNDQAAELLMLGYEAKAVKPTQLAKVWDEWRQPSNAVFVGEDTIWGLMNAITEVNNQANSGKGLNPFELQARTQRLHPLFDGVCGIQIGATSIEIDGDAEDAEFIVHGENQIHHADGTVEDLPPNPHFPMNG